MDKNKLKVLSLADIIASVIFSLCCFSWHFDVSLLAFPMALFFTAAVYVIGFNYLFSKEKVNFFVTFRILLQYLPYVLLIAFVLRRAGNYGTAYVTDILGVSLWCVVSGINLIVLFYLNPKRLARIDVNWKKYVDAHGLSSFKGTLRIVLEAFSWVDALLQAVFMVLLLNIFIVQLYEIPSESMVPEFLIKDRVIVVKTASGPKFPLSEIGIPYMRSYKRGDIVVFRNPHYANDRKSEVKTFVSQLVYMCTLTLKNINVDANGGPKADPLVKRVAGIPGEQLMMQDGTLYSRTSESDEWNAVEMDSKYAAWDLNSVRPALKKGIHDFPLTAKTYEKMLQIESNRRDFDLKLFKYEAADMASQFRARYNLYNSHKSVKAEQLINNLQSVSFIQNHAEITKNLLESPDGAEIFTSYMTDWLNSEKSDFQGDLYEEANYKMNLMIKKIVGKIVLNDARLISSGTNVQLLSEDSAQILYFYMSYLYEKIPEDKLNTLKKDSKLQSDLITDAYDLFSYVAEIQDRRNMPVFPANKDGKPQYIPENCYFMMGDNRFNSLDMRHSYDFNEKPLTESDRYSFLYQSCMEPQVVHKNRILGTASYRFWPLNRRGVPGHTGM